GWLRLLRPCAGRLRRRPRPVTARRTSAIRRHRSEPGGARPCAAGRPRLLRRLARRDHARRDRRQPRRDGRRTPHRRRRPDRVVRLARPPHRHATNRDATVNDSHTSPLVRFLRDPSQHLAHAAATLAHALVHLLPLALMASLIVAALLVTRLVLARLREQRLARGARRLELAVPPELDIDGALLLWSSLHDLLRPRVARLVGGQPQLAWEIAADHTGTRFRLW